MIRPFGLPITCPVCGGPMGLVNATASGSQSIAVVACDPCRRQWQVAATMRPFGFEAAHRGAGR